MSKHSIRSGRLSRLSASRSSSSACTRRNCFCSAANVAESSASRAFWAASSASRRFSPRAGVRTSTREPRSSERNSCNASSPVASGGTTICGGIDGALP